MAPAVRDVLLPGAPAGLPGSPGPHPAPYLAPSPGEPRSGPAGLGELTSDANGYFRFGDFPQAFVPPPLSPGGERLSGRNRI